jgi:O-antigen ligase
VVAIERLRGSREDAEKLPRWRVRAITTEDIVFVVFVGGLAWVPFWFGSNRPIPWGINALLFSGLAALYELALLLRGAARPVAIRNVWLPAVLFALAAIWALFQNATWAPAAWQHPIWELASEVLGRPIPGSISVDRDLTAIALLRLMTAASVFWLALQLCRDAARARLLIWAVAGIGAVYAAVGLFALGFLPGGTVFPELNSSPFVTSTFVSQNHYATFAGIGLVAAVAGILRLYRRAFAQSGRIFRLKVATLIRTTGSQGALPLALALLILAALLLSGSRGGIISTALGLFVLITLNLRRTKRSSRNETLLTIFAFLLVGVAFIGFGDAFVGRLETQGLHDENRLPVAIVTIWSILSSPFLGFGYGTFLAAFPMFRDDSMSIWSFWDRAHNTYLEVFQGLGLVFGAMLIASVVLLVWECIKGARTRQRDATIAAVAGSVSFLVGVHALVDFSLQIQAVTLTYMAVLGAGVAQARDDAQLRHSSLHYSRASDYSR